MKFNPQPKPEKSENGRNKLIKILDSAFSIFIRSKNISTDGLVECFTCKKVLHITLMDCGHFIPRANMLTRWESINCKPQCKECNQVNDGMLDVFEKNLLEHYPNTKQFGGKTVIEWLRDCSKKSVHFSIDEIRAKIKIYKKKNGKRNLN